MLMHCSRVAHSKAGFVSQKGGQLRAPVLLIASSVLIESEDGSVSLQIPYRGCSQMWSVFSK